LGDGGTNGSPVSSKYIERRQPRIGTTDRSTARFRSCLASSASSPSVMP
jgi:hypothetical protein